MSGTTADTWVRMLLSACVSMILTGTGAWFTFGQNKITRVEMVEYVAQQNIPTDLRLDTTEASTSELRSLVKSLTEQQQSLTIELRTFVAEIRASKK